MQFYSLWALILLLFLPAVVYFTRRKRQTAAVKFPSLVDMRHCPISWRLRFRWFLKAARLVCLSLLILAFARPRKGTVLSEISTEGVAIEAVVDRSGSMSIEMSYAGNKVSRLEVVKDVLADFIKGDDKGLSGRTSDLIGMVTFARYADTTCPLVLSHNVLLEFMKNTDIARRSEDGTAIGDAIALAAARLKKAEEELKRRNEQLRLVGSEDQQDKEQARFKIKSKAMILLTDGQNNAGQYDPVEAARLAKKWGIKIYTIGIGSDEAYTMVNTPLGSFKMPIRQTLDEKLLKTIAEETGGFYGRADDAEGLRDIVKRIDELERTEVKTIQYMQYAELFGMLTLPALILLALEMLAQCTVFRKIP